MKISIRCLVPLLALIIASCSALSAAAQTRPNIPVDQCLEICNDAREEAIAEVTDQHLLEVEIAGIEHDMNMDQAYSHYLHTAANCLDFTCVLAALDQYNTEVDAYTFAYQATLQLLHIQLLNDLNNIENGYDFCVGLCTEE